MRAKPIFLALTAAATLAATSATAGDAERIVAYSIVDAREIPASLTGQSGDPEAGRKLYADPDLTGCAGCHGIPGGAGAGTEGVASQAPSLDRVASRLSEGAIRLWIVAPQVLKPETDMPSYYAVGQRTDPHDPRYGETRLGAAEIEDIVAYLLSAGDGR